MDPLTIDRTPNEDCLDCRMKSRHRNLLEWRFYHPLAGHGYTKELGWTHEDLKKHEGLKKHELS